MAIKSITIDGDYILPSMQGSEVMRAPFTAVKIMENSANAIATFGSADQDGNFVAYSGGEIANDAVIQHGNGG